MIIIDSNVVQNSIKHYGSDMQTTVCMEECSELIQAISKMKRGKDNRDNLIEEIADVIIGIGKRHIRSGTEYDRLSSLTISGKIRQ